MLLVLEIEKLWFFINPFELLLLLLIKCTLGKGKRER